MSKFSKFVPTSPEIGPINWDIRANKHGETHIPFSCYVRPEKTHNLETNFLPFSRLPFELQIYVFQFCDSNTLFQLMGVTSPIRRESMRLFWSNSQTRYLIDGSWLLAGGFPGDTYYSLDALACMQHVEINFKSSLSLRRRRIRLDSETVYSPPAITNEKREQRARFWETLRRRLPSAISVMLSEDSRDYEEESVPSQLITVAERCPAGIRTSISRVEPEPGYPRRLKRTTWYQSAPINGLPGLWEVVDPVWPKTRVQPPLKALHGVVGQFALYLRLRYSVYERERAKYYFVIKAIEGYYFQDKHGPCICPATGCGLRFELPGQWAAHAVDAKHCIDIEAPTEHLKALLRDYSATTEAIQQQRKDLLAELCAAWGEEKSEQRRDAENAFLHQLQHDPLYTSPDPPCETDIWTRYRNKMDDEDDLHDYGY